MDQNLNALSGPGFGLGTSNNYPLKFYTNNTLRFTICTGGSLTINSYAGLGYRRIVMLDSNGKFLPLPKGSDGQVLYSNCSWGSLPAAIDAFSFSNSKLLTSSSTSLGLGVSSPEAKLDVSGGVNITGGALVGNQLAIGSSNDNMILAYTPSTSSSPAWFSLQRGTSSPANGGGNTGSPDPQPGDCANSLGNSALLASALAAHHSPANNLFIGHTGTKAFIESQGSSTGTSNHKGDLFLNYNCNRNVFVFGGTATGFENGANSVMSVGGRLNVTQNAQIGYYSSTSFLDNYTLLNINGVAKTGVKVRAGSGGYGVKVVELSDADIGIAVNRSSNNGDGNQSFAVYGDGSTMVNTIMQLGYSSASTFLDNSTSLNVNGASKTGIKVRAGGTGYGVKIVETTDSDIALQVNKTTDASDGARRFSVRGDGTTMIGTLIQPGTATHGDALLTVNGKMVAKSCFITLSDWADYVFENDYKLMPLQDLHKYLVANKHLPNVPSAKEITKSDFSLDIAAMQKIQMEKIEELYLYIIELQKQIEELKKEK